MYFISMILNARCAAGLVDTDLAKDLVTRVQGIVGKETAATFTVRVLDSLRTLCSLPRGCRRTCSLQSSCLIAHRSRASMARTPHARSMRQELHGPKSVTCMLAKRTAFVPQFTPEASVQKQLAYLSGTTQATDNGRFVDYDGKDMPW